MGAETVADIIDAHGIEAVERTKIALRIPPGLGQGFEVFYFLRINGSGHGTSPKFESGGICIRMLA
jgi:hypothetical protein